MLHFLSVFLLVCFAPVVAGRDTRCDDGFPQDVVKCIIPLPSTLSDFVCGTNGILALLDGCYLCVDATTCAALDSAHNFNAEAQDKPLPKASGNDISILLQDQADNSPDESNFEQAAAVPKAAATRTQIDNSDDTPKGFAISNWLFSIPVCLAIVSLGLAIRSRVPPRRRGFQRLQDHNRNISLLFQDNINPFCSNDEDVDIETAGHFQGDPSNSESEEAQFLPSAELEEDEVTQAESDAIKQAVMLHIKEFDEQDDEEEDEEVEI